MADEETHDLVEFWRRAPECLAICREIAAYRACDRVTLGLPIVRTSVDHGTALDIAGSGSADHGSMVSAIISAGDIVKHRLKHPV